MLGRFHSRRLWLAIVSLVGLLAGVMVFARSREPRLLPRLDVPSAALLVREHIDAVGAERTGNWRWMFDMDGCWRQAANTWMWVTDPVLAKSDEPSLFFNGVWSEPWFCLDPSQRAELVAGIRASRFVEVAHKGAVDRWIAVVGGQTLHAVLPADARPAEMAPLFRVLERLARQGVWGRSPE